MTAPKFRLSQLINATKAKLFQWDEQHKEHNTTQYNEITKKKQQQKLLIKPPKK